MEDYQQADLAVNNNMYYIDLILLYDVAAVIKKCYIILYMLPFLSQNQVINIEAILLKTW